MAFLQLARSVPRKVTVSTERRKEVKLPSKSRNLARKRTRIQILAIHRENKQILQLRLNRNESGNLKLRRLTIPLLLLLRFPPFPRGRYPNELE